MTDLFRWLVLILAAIVAFFMTILPMTALAAFLLLAIGICAEVAMPCAVVFAAVYIVVCIVRGVMK